MSRVGERPIQVPKEVKVEIKDRSVSVTGPKGKLSYELPSNFKAAMENGVIKILRPTDSKQDLSFHGLARSLINNMVVGVTEGYSKHLELAGMGFKAQVQGKNLNLQLGFSHPVNFPIPEGITIETPKPVQITVKGIDKYLVGEVTAKIRSYYKPEPYKGKGMRYAGEYVRRKAGKAVA